MKYPVVCVEWIDSAGVSGWHDMDRELVAPVYCTSVGFLIHKDKKLLTLALQYSDSGQVGELMTIPRVSVRSMKRLG